MGVDGKLHNSAALPPGKRTSTHHIGAGWAPGPVWTGTKNLTPPSRFDPWAVQYIIASRYTDYAIPVDILLCRNNLKTWRNQNIMFCILTTHHTFLQRTMWYLSQPLTNYTNLKPNFHSMCYLTWNNNLQNLLLGPLNFVWKQVE